MRLRPCCVVVLIVLLVPSAARAHDHVWDFSFGPATATGSRLWGAQFSFGVTIPKPLEKDLSVLIDVTNVKGNDGTNDITQLAYLGGLRYALYGHHSRDKNVLLVHGLVGTVYKQNGATGDFELAGKIGASYERLLGSHAPGGWAARVQVEHSFVTEGPIAKSYTQISAGVVKRFN